jgi:hypothetical protein
MSSFVSWTVPPAGAHPRIFVNPNSGSPSNGPTIATLQSRIATTHADQYAKLLAFVNPRVANPTTYNLAYYKAQNWEYLAASAFVYLMDNSRTDAAAHARDIALSMAVEAVGTKTNQRREIMVAMAVIYDWLYNWSGFTDANKQTIRNKLGNTSQWIDTYRTVADSNYTWGTDHGHMVKAMLAITAILNDSNLNGGSGNPSNATWNGWMDTMMDNHDNGGNGSSYLALFRYFCKDDAGNVVGGTYKGSGNASYWERNQEFYVALLTALKSAVGVNWIDTEPWWNQSIWDLWHWRGDRTFHRQGEHLGQDNYNPFQHAHVYITSKYQKSINMTMAQNIKWLAEEMTRNDATVKQAIWGPYMVYRILHEDTTLAGVRPTVSSMGGSQLKYFQRLGKVVLRDGWEETSTSVTISAPKYWLGQHTRRDAGHWDLCTKGSPVFIENGHYDGNEVTTYKAVPAGVFPTGHRHTYMKNGCSLSTLRIHHSGEPGSNPIESFQRDSGTGSSALLSRFGVRNGTDPVTISNYGGQLWIKNTANTASQPADLADLLAEAKWQLSTWPQTPVVDSKFSYVVTNLAPWYWATKCSRYKKHFIWINTGSVPSWTEPILLILEDVIATNDATYTNRSVVTQFQSNAPPTGNATSLTYTKGTNAKVYYKALNPTSLQMQTINGYYDNDGVVYPPSKTSNHDDSIFPAGSEPWRTEIYPTTYSGSIQLLYAMFPCDRSAVTHPAMTFSEDATWWIVTFTADQIECKIKKGDTHQVIVQSVPASVPPIPSGPSTNNNRRSAPMSIPGTTIPVPDGSLDRSNRVHICYLYAGTVPTTPPVDISTGAPLECDEVILDGEAIPTSTTTPGFQLLQGGTLSGNLNEP